MIWLLIAQRVSVKIWFSAAWTASSQFVLSPPRRGLESQLVHCGSWPELPPKSSPIEGNIGLWWRTLWPQSTSTTPLPFSAHRMAFPVSCGWTRRRVGSVSLLPHTNMPMFSCSKCVAYIPFPLTWVGVSQFHFMESQPHTCTVRYFSLATIIKTKSHTTSTSKGFDDTLAAPPTENVPACVYSCQVMKLSFVTW